MPRTVLALNLTDKWIIFSSRYLYIPFTLNLTTFTNRISCPNFAYSAATKPRSSAKNIDIKIFLSPPTQPLFTVNATSSIMNSANMYLFLTWLKKGYHPPCFNLFPL